MVIFPDWSCEHTNAELNCYWDLYLSTILWAIIFQLRKIVPKHPPRTEIPGKTQLFSIALLKGTLPKTNSSNLKIFNPAKKPSIFQVNFSLLVSGFSPFFFLQKSSKMHPNRQKLGRCIHQTWQGENDDVLSRWCLNLCRMQFCVSDSKVEQSRSYFMSVIHKAAMQSYILYITYRDIQGQPEGRTNTMWYSHQTFLPFHHSLGQLACWKTWSGKDEAWNNAKCGEMTWNNYNSG